MKSSACPLSEHAAKMERRYPELYGEIVEALPATKIP